jgi:hypothetical protein
VKQAAPSQKQGVSHTVALPFTFKSILRQKKNYRNSNISPCKHIIIIKTSKRNQNISRYITNLNTSQNIILRKSSYKNRPITQGPKSLKLLYSIMNLNTNNIVALLGARATKKKLWAHPLTN